MMVRYLPLFCLGLLLGGQLQEVGGFTLGESDLSLTLTDAETGVSPVSTVFVQEKVGVVVQNITWEGSRDADSFLWYTTSIDGEVVAEGKIYLSEDEEELPTSIFAGEAVVSNRGSTKIEVKLAISDSKASASVTVQSFRGWVTLFPFLAIIFATLITAKIELGLIAGIFVGACMEAGTIVDGFRSMVDTYLFEAVADASHIYLCLSTLFMGGLFAMIKESGGLAALTRDFARSATWSRNGQLAVFGAGLLFFFDDYVSILVVGKTVAPLMDLMSISREKLSFLVDATASPVSSINPGSIWAGFEIGLIQAEIDKIIERNGGINDLSIETSGMAAFVKSIGYRYYPIIILILIPILILTERDCGPMLIAERRARVLAFGSKVKTDGDGLKPSRDTPTRFWNMLFPLVALVFFLFLNFASSVIDGDAPASAETYSAFAVSVFTSAVFTQMFYSLQYKKDGELAWLCLPHQRDGAWVWLAPIFQPKQKTETVKDIESGSKQASRTSKHTNNSTESTSQDDAGSTASANQDGIVPPKQAAVEIVLAAAEGSADGSEMTTEKEDTTEQRPTALLSFREGMDSFLNGMGDVFPILVLLTLAWAFGSLLTVVGTDRFISRMVTSDRIRPEILPTLAFIASLFISLVTGSSWGTMTIMFPLALVPAFEASGGDADIFYATISGISCGAVAGDHVSPISSTSILAAHATNCDLHTHIRTQAPYAIMVIVSSIALGTIPVSFGAYPNVIAYLLSILYMVFFVYILCAPILDAKGRFDCFTEWWTSVARNGDSEVKELKALTMDAYQRNQVNIETAKGESAIRKEKMKAKKAARTARIEEKRAKRKRESEVKLAAQSRLAKERKFFQQKLEEERLRQAWNLHLQKRMIAIQKKITALEGQKQGAQEKLEPTTEVRNAQISTTDTAMGHEKEAEITQLYAELGAVSQDYTALTEEINRVKVQGVTIMCEIGQKESDDDAKEETHEADQEEGGFEGETDEEENENDEDDTEDDTTQATSVTSKFTRYEPHDLQQFDAEPNSAGYELLLSIGKALHTHFEDAAEDDDDHSFDELMQDVSYTFEGEVSETEIRSGGRSKSRGGLQEETASLEGEETDGQEEGTVTDEECVGHQASFTTEESTGTWNGILISNTGAPKPSASAPKDEREVNNDHFRFVF